jgi:diguanylate cyclase (GGDEF)-like protein
MALANSSRAGGSRTPQAVAAKPGFSLGSAWRIASVRWIICIGLLTTAAIIAAGGYAVSDLRQNALKNAERELQNVASVIAEQFERMFEALTLTQLGVVRDIQMLDIRTAEEFERRLAKDDIHQELRKKIANLLPVRELMVASASGKVVNSSRSFPPMQGSIAGEDYFKELTSPSSFAVPIGAPVQDPATNRWRFHVAQRVMGSSGEFIGAVIGVMELSYFEQLFITINLGDGSSVSLVRKDGRLLARYPRADMASAPSYASNPLFSTILPRNGKGVVHIKGVLDRSDRVVAGQNLARAAVAVSVGLDTDAALQEWRTTAVQIAGTAALVLLVVGGMIILCARYVGRDLSSQKFKLDTALNNMSHGLCMFNARGVLRLLNERFLDIYNIPQGLIAPGITLRELAKRLQDVGVAAHTHESYISELEAAVAAGKTIQFVRTLNNGNIINVTNRPLPNGGWVATHEDVTELKRREEELKSEKAQIAHMAHHDALTDLCNRTLLRERLNEALRHVNRGGQLAVLYLDLDHFKNVNDTLGHNVGDELLKIVAQRLRSCVREVDTVARLGGDEFAVVQTDVSSPSDAALLAQRIRDMLAQPYELGDHHVPADVSIGISVAPNDSSDPDQLLKNADMALYRSKADGRGTFRFFEPEMDQLVKARRTLELDLRNAIARDEFELYYQPIVNLDCHTISGCETLIRWNHPTRGLVSPMDFIPVAEETGLINQIGDWVLQHACIEAVRWPNDICVAVNLSPVQFKNPGLTQRVVMALAKSGLQPHRLELEITETVLLQNTEATLAMLRQLRDLGVRIAMDDFGTGYSSLSYLRSFPFDKIKIDRSFIKDVADKEDSSAIVQAVTDLAGRLHMVTTAEGIETQEQLRKIESLGCTEMQGYLYSPPVPARDLQRFFSDGDSHAARIA